MIYFLAITGIYWVAFCAGIFDQRITVGIDFTSFCIGISQVVPKADIINMRLIKVNLVPVLTVFIAVPK